MTMTLAQIRQETREVEKEKHLKKIHVGTPGRSEQVYQFIVTYKRGHDGNSPTFREIMEGCGITSTSVVLYYLKGLERRGLIRRPEPEIGNRNATKIEIVGGQWGLHD